MTTFDFVDDLRRAEFLVVAVVALLIGAILMDERGWSVSSAVVEKSSCLVGVSLDEDLFTSVERLSSS